MMATVAGVFELPQADKEAAMLPALAALTHRHRTRGAEYARILAATGHGPGRVYESIADLPWLPVRLFKTHVLKSIEDSEVFKVLTSSGTTGPPSRIYLDKEAAAAQTRSLARTIQAAIGTRRLPMLIVDTKSIIKDRRTFSARGAGVLGMANFGRDHVWALDEDARPDVEAIRGFLARRGSEPFLIFGFTFMVWQYLYEVANEHALDLSYGVLIHSGGWKKLVDRAVDNATFRAAFAADTGLSRIHNFYGMVEQIGVVYLEGPSGDGLYCPDFADVIIRDPQTWQEQPVGVPGLVEVVSTLPESYPGHALLTEDLGVVRGIDDGDWPGKRLSILGRLPRAEARGCSDTMTPTPPASRGQSEPAPV